MKTSVAGCWMFQMTRRVGQELSIELLRWLTWRSRGVMFESCNHTGLL